jgi:hypothetical protein
VAEEEEEEEAAAAAAAAEQEQEQEQEERRCLYFGRQGLSPVALALHAESCCRVYPCHPCEPPSNRIIAYVYNDLK